ncbi:MAG: prenyltransferase [Bacteroidaceae bacterium]|nr:prenyltransferase [Bacteroidaceae bacterium]
MPVLVTLAYLNWCGYAIDWITGVWALLNIVIFHAAGNTWSDYFDYKRGVDREDAIGGMSIVSGEFQACEIKRLAWCLLSVAVVAGIGLMLYAGLPVLYFGLAGCALILLYPWLKYHALGDLDIFLTYSVLPILGTSFVATGYLHKEVLWLMLPIGLITVGILHVNNARDIEQDSRAGIKTFAMLIGKRASVVFYIAELMLPFVAILVAAIYGAMPWWALVVVIALKPAIDNCRAMLKLPTEGMKALVGVDEKTAQLQLMFSLLLSVSLFVTAML